MARNIAARVPSGRAGGPGFRVKNAQPGLRRVPRTSPKSNPNSRLSAFILVSSVYVPQLLNELAQLSLSGSFEDTLDRNYFGVLPLCSSVTAPALPPGQVEFHACRAGGRSPQRKTTRSLPQWVASLSSPSTGRLWRLAFEPSHALPRLTGRERSSPIYAA